MSRLVAIFLILLSLQVYADPFDLLGAEGASAGLAGNSGSRQGGAASAYYNPAFLALEDSFETVVGFLWYKPWIQTPLIRGGSLGNIPTFRGSTPQETYGLITSSIDRATGIQDLYGIVIGEILSFRRLFPKLQRGISVGLILFLPSGGREIVNIQALDANSPQFPYFGNNDQRMLLAVSGGFEVIRDLLYLGAGTLILADISGSTYSSTPIAIFDPQDPSNPPPPPSSTATFQQDLSLDAAPVVGLLVRPADWVDLGVTWQGELSLDLDFAADARVMIDLGVPMDAKIPYHLRTGLFYLPSRLTTSVTFHYKGLSITGQVGVAFTKDYSKHAPVTSFQLDPSAVGDKGQLKDLEDFGYLRAVGSPLPKIHTRHTVIPGVALSYAFSKVPLVLRCGYTYIPSPLDPDQGYDNLLLSSGLHRIALGAGYRLLKWDKGGLYLDISSGLGVFNRRYNLIGNGKDAKGIVETKGHALSLGFSLRVKY